MSRHERYYSRCIKDFSLLPLSWQLVWFLMSSVCYPCGKVVSWLLASLFHFSSTALGLFLCWGSLATMSPIWFAHTPPLNGYWFLVYILCTAAEHQSFASTVETEVHALYLPGGHFRTFWCIFVRIESNAKKHDDIPWRYQQHFLQSNLISSWNQCKRWDNHMFCHVTYTSVARECDCQSTWWA